MHLIFNRIRLPVEVLGKIHENDMNPLGIHANRTLAEFFIQFWNV